MRLKATDTKFLLAGFPLPAIFSNIIIMTNGRQKQADENAHTRHSLIPFSTISAIRVHLLFNIQVI